MNIKIILIIILFVVGCTHVSEEKTNQTEENFNLEEYYSDDKVQEETKVEEKPSLLTGGATKEISNIQKEKKEDSGKVEAAEIVKSVKEQLIGISRSLKLKADKSDANNTFIDSEKINYEMARDMLAQAEKDLEKGKYDDAKKHATLARETADKIGL